MCGADKAIETVFVGAGVLVFIAFVAIINWLNWRDHKKSMSRLYGNEA
jgi:hypothetical protein